MKTKTYLIFAISIIVSSITIAFQSCNKENEEPNKPPTCKIISPTASEDISKGETIEVYVNATDSDGKITEVVFFIDGISKAASSDVPYTFDWVTNNENIGSHTIKATSEDNDGATISDEISINIIQGGNSPIASFTANQINGQKPLNVNFSDQSSNNPTTWLWNFGDGNESSQQNPSHTYYNAGVYTVSLTATNEFGTNTKTKNGYINVSNSGNVPIADFSANPTNGQEPLTVSFIDQSSNIPTTWLWNFGDGNTSSQQNPSHTYYNAGVYTVSLTATNEFGTNTKTKNGYINVSNSGNAPIADFSANPTNGQEPLTVTFIDQSSNIPTTWLWNFGDGNTSSQQNPSHTYYNAGVYTVSLTVMNDFGTDTDTKTNFITVTSSNSFTDPRDGQTYATVEIGTQTWFAENLNYETANSWCYENSSSNCDVYGRLYTWGEALTVCPNGWHLPSDSEWQILVDYLGGSSVAGGKLKEAGYTHWSSPNAGATNSSGFTALPGGIRSDVGSFHQFNTQGRWWTATGFSSQMAWRNTLSYNLEQVSRFTDNKGYGLSVRCIKD